MDPDGNISGIALQDTAAVPAPEMNVLSAAMRCVAQFIPCSLAFFKGKERVNVRAALKMAYMAYCTPLLYILSSYLGILAIGLRLEETHTHANGTGQPTLICSTIDLQRSH